MDDLATALQDAGGVDAPRERVAQLRRLLAGELRHGAVELQQARSGYAQPVSIVIAAAGDADGAGLRAVLPVAPTLRADPDAIGERAWLLAAATLGALVEAGASGPVHAGRLGDALVLALPGDSDAELAVLAFDEHAGAIDRLRARALAAPAQLLDEATDLRPPIGSGHPLLVAAEVARQGGRPADQESVDALADTVLALLQATGDPGAARPHDDPDPPRRVARRILQRLAGMGKWGGYHTEFAHLARGFAPSDRALASAVGEALLAAGLLAEKPSVGQRHVFLDPRRAGDIHALIDRGELPAGLVLPAS
jgi:hypothetical protein